MGNQAWHIIDDRGDTVGPLSTTLVQGLIARGSLHADSPVCCKGDQQWSILGDTEPFASLFDSRPGSPHTASGGREEPVVAAASTVDSEWYVAKSSGETIGPLSTGQIVSGIGTGIIPQDASVCPADGQQWEPIESVPAFRVAFNHSSAITATPPEWFLCKPGGEPEGPFPSTVIGKLVRAGALSVDAMVCRAGADRWTPIHQAPELAQWLPQAPSPDGDSKPGHPKEQRRAQAQPASSPQSALSGTRVLLIGGTALFGVVALAVVTVVAFASRKHGQGGSCESNDSCKTDLICFEKVCTTQAAADLSCATRPACAEEGQCKARWGKCAATDESCSKTSICLSAGRCTELGGRCVATNETCRRTLECKLHAACSAVNGDCTVTDEDCSASAACRVFGGCKEANGTCAVAASTDAECNREYGSERYNPCRVDGLCSGRGTCTASSDDDCEKSKNCVAFGHCAASGGSCVAGTDDHCNRHSYVIANACKGLGRCYARGGDCVARFDQDCKESLVCRDGGQCSAKDGRCMALSDADCHYERSIACPLLAKCTARDGICVATAESCAAAPLCQTGPCSFENGECKFKGERK